MVLQIFPEPTVAGSINADSYTVPLALTTYKIVKNFDAAVYTITTSPNTSQATIDFYTESTILNTVTVSGTVTLNLATAHTGAFVVTNTGSNVVVTITKVASALSGTALSGTLDTLTTSGTYNQTGLLFVLGVGGGGGGGGAGGSNNLGGGGGGSGGVTSILSYFNNSTSYTIGSAGNGGIGSGGNGNSGGATSFGNLLSINGGASSSGGGENGGSGGSGGGNGGQGGSNSSPGNASTFIRTSIVAGTTGGGGGGAAIGQGTTAKAGAGSGIGTGGSGGAHGQNGGAGTGYGSGGGGSGSSNSNTTGGAGAPGVIYVLRGF
jgi:hypothetical protein